MMSNALYADAAPPQAPPALAESAQVVEQAGPFPNWFVGLLAVGIVLTVVWIVRRVAYPRKVSLVHTPGRSNSLTPLHLLVLMLAVLLIVRTASLVLSRFTLAQGRQTILLMAMLQLLSLFGGLAVALMSFDLGIRRGMGLTLRRWRTGTVRGVIACLIALPACLGLLLLTHYVLAALGIQIDPGHPLLRTVRQTPLPWQVLICFMTIVLAPLSEEIVFRGLLQSMLRQYTRRPWVAILVTSVLFAAMHYQVWSTIPSLMLLSVMLGYNYERTGRLLPSIVAHAAFNAIFILQTLTA